MLAQVIFGADTRSAPSMFGGQYLLIGPLFISAAQVVAFIVAVIATVAVEALLLGTRWGRTVRAVADDIEAAELVGLHSQFINISAFALACGLAGIAGTIMVTYYPTDPSKGLSLMPIAIIATTIGGLGSIRGSFLGRHLLRHGAATYRDAVELRVAGRAALCAAAGLHRLSADRHVRVPDRIA